VKKRILPLIGLACSLTIPSWAIVTTGLDPNDAMYLAPAGGPFDGVAALRLTFGASTFGCSGSLLSTGMHILTAGHCVADFFGAPTPDSTTVRFITGLGTTDILAADYDVFPLWDGDLFSGTDLAIITLASLAPADALRYDIYNLADEVGQVGELAGFGLAGTGSTGPTIGFGTRRHGSNLYDTEASFFFLSGNILLMDFDSGSAVNDALGLAGLPDLGLGLSEVLFSFGDSGGPTFLNGKIAGVHSFIASYGFCPPDVITPPNFVGPVTGCKVDSSFGELAGDTRVSSFDDFIASVIIPEPGSMALVALGFAAAVFVRRRRPA